MSTVNINVNNKNTGPIEVPDGTKMIDFLHEYLNLTGTKFGCGIGVCHACTVIVEGENGVNEVVRTCISGIERFEGKKVRTVEGLAKRNTAGEITELTPVQRTFLEHFSFQCGWCTSGFINETTALIERLEQAPIPENKVESTIEDALNDHVCRCTGYVKYYEGVKNLILNTKGLTY